MYIFGPPLHASRVELIVELRLDERRTDIFCLRNYHVDNLLECRGDGQVPGAVMH